MSRATGTSDEPVGCGPGVARPSCGEGVDLPTHTGHLEAIQDPLMGQGLLQMAYWGCLGGLRTGDMS